MLNCVAPVKQLTYFPIQCLQVCVDMWLKCLAAGRMIITVQKICRKPQTWESGWLSVQTIFFNSAACVIDYSWEIIIFKSCHNDIKNNTRAFTLYHFLETINFLLGAAAGNNEESWCAPAVFWKKCRTSWGWAVPSSGQALACLTLIWFGHFGYIRFGLPKFEGLVW